MGAITLINWALPVHPPPAVSFSCGASFPPPPPTPSQPPPLITSLPSPLTPLSLTPPPAYPHTNPLSPLPPPLSPPPLQYSSRPPLPPPPPPPLSPLPSPPHPFSPQPPISAPDPQLNTRCLNINSAAVAGPYLLDPHSLEAYQPPPCSICWWSLRLMKVLEWGKCRTSIAPEPSVLKMARSLSSSSIRFVESSHHRSELAGRTG